MTNVNNKSNKIDEEKLLCEVEKWTEEHPYHFGKKDKVFYDRENLYRIKRFAGAPIGYIEERIELNKEVSKGYHKLHLNILLAGFTGLYVYLLARSIVSITEISNICKMTFSNFANIILFIILISGGVIAVIWQYYGHLTAKILKWIGILRVIRDSEIEIYYLSLIKENRNKIRCLKCNLEIPKGSKFCNNCGYEIK